MTSATPFVPIRACRPPVRVTSLQDLLDAGEVGHDLLPERREPDIGAGALDLDRLGRWGGQEVDDSFVVDFDIRTTKEVFASGVFDVGEDILHGSGDNARLVVVTRLEEGKWLASIYEKGARTRLTKVKVFPDAVCPYANTTEL